MSDERKGTGFTIGTWSGLDNYECDFCPFAAAGARGLDRIKRHVAGHFMRGESPRETGEAAMEFTAAATEALEAIEDDDLRDAVTMVLLESEPSGKTGFTKADVVGAIEALTEEE